MTDGASSLLNSLPGRPLTTVEGKKLENQETKSFWIRLESIILFEEDPVVMALLAINRVCDQVWFIGYDPDQTGGGIVEEWNFEELEQDMLYKRLEDWEAETFNGP